MNTKSTLKNNPNKENLYSALLFINNLYDLEDLLQLKSSQFLKICEVQAIDWNFKAHWLKKKFLIKEKKNWPFQYTIPLIFKTKNYGEIIFYSSQKLTQRKKNFLKKVSSFISSILFSIENKENLSHIKKQWVNTFDSFSQAFCITDKDFKIIRSNQAFQKLFKKNKNECTHENIFNIFPFFIDKPELIEKEGSFLAQGEINKEKIYWEVSFKTLYLKKESSKAFLFLINNVTEEMKMESLLAHQAKEQELGLIKGSLAHELNNPIAGIKALLSVIERSVPQNQHFITKSLKDMQKAMNTCHQVVQSLLLASKKKPRVLDQS
ncbi:MAG: hypothetical protein OXC37_04670 [Bdellovibrionaceae bacterium]|nr:hypothetical protein [Pseudobdellovibrionaceae bacterium]